MRGYFGVGVEGVSKRGNVESLMRTAHGFGASFFFAVAPVHDRGSGDRGRGNHTDTSETQNQVPTYVFADPEGMQLPKSCRLVGVEVADDAIPLPSFHHPRCAAYVFGRERGTLTGGMLKRCDFLVRIPTRFALNVAVAGAIVLYDRMLCHGRFPQRPLWPEGAVEPLPEPRFGAPLFRKPENTPPPAELLVRPGPGRKAP